ncbi:hypothetical protein GCM10027296_38390 [Chitinimonas naiadis]
MASQRGIMLLESLVAILIFSVGILGLVALQSKAVALEEDAKYRVQAAYLANLYISQVWSGDFANACSVYAQGSTAYNAWASVVQNSLPGVTSTTNQPTVTPVCTVSPTTVQISVTVRWKMPSSPTTHSYTTSA